MISFNCFSITSRTVTRFILEQNTICMHVGWINILESFALFGDSPSINVVLSLSSAICVFESGASGFPARNFSKNFLASCKSSRNFSKFWAADSLVLRYSKEYDYEKSDFKCQYLMRNAGTYIRFASVQGCGLHAIKYPLPPF